MGIFKKILSFFVLSDTISHKIYIPKDVFLKEIKKEIKRKKNIYGKISKDQFYLYFFSRISVKRTSPFPFIEIVGNIENIEKNRRIKVNFKLSLSSIPRYLLIISLIAPLIIGVFLYYNNNFSLVPLIITPFVYFIVLINYKIELSGFKTYYNKYLYNTLTKYHKKNKLVL